MTAVDGKRRLSALELRREFDQAFSLEPAVEREASLDLLTLEVGADRYALRGAEIRGILPMPKLTRVPSALPELLGISGIRGALVPVFDLGKLLAQEASQKLARWLFLVGDKERVAFAFHVFDRQLRVPEQAVSGVEAGAVAGDFAHEIVQLSGKAVPIISIELLLSAIEKRSAPAARVREKS